MIGQSPAPLPAPSPAAGGSRAVGPRGRLRLGVVGCGAIAEQAHLPAALSSNLVEVVALADASVARLRHLEQRFGLQVNAVSDYRDLLEHVAAVVLALPNHLHAPVGLEFLSRGIHVLCEKPLATTFRDCRALCEAARANRAILAVGYVTRFYPSTELAKRLLADRFLGKVTSFDYEGGVANEWAALSGYNWARATAGGGVLIDSHFIDRLLYLFGQPELIRYEDDSRGGVEANCQVSLTCSVAGRRVPGTITLSKTHPLANRLLIRGEKGSLELREGEARVVTFRPAGREYEHQISATGSPPSGHAYVRAQLEDFVQAIQSGTEPRVNGEAGSRSVALVERCYATATRRHEPWLEASLPRLQIGPSTTPVLATGQDGSGDRRDGEGRGRVRVLITGATGFIGSRLCEVMALNGLGQPRAFIHSTARAARIARLPLEFVSGDLCDRRAVEKAVQDCDAVVHLAWGDRPVMRRGLHNVLQAAMEAGVRRFVHMSSVAVYGDHPPPESASEAAPVRHCDNEYGREKLRQERLVLRYVGKHGLPAVVLRPPNVYGPFSPFTLRLLQKIRRGVMAVVHDGPCNLVYVDNLVQAVLLGLARPEAVGQVFFVTDGDAVTWGQCLRDHARWVGAELPEASEAELVQPPRPRLFLDSVRLLPPLLVSREFRSVIRQIPLARAAEALLYRTFQSLAPETQQRLRQRVNGSSTMAVTAPASPRFSADDDIIADQLRKVVHSNEKARRLLGYTAPVSYREGMQLTEAWLRATRVI